MRQEAWLAAVPKAPNEKAITETDKRSRRERRLDDGLSLDLPPLNAAYLSRIFFEVGPTLSTGMGPTLLTHLELRAYQDNTGIRLSPWEVRTLRRLSSEWIAQSHKAEQADCPAPYVVDVEAIRERMPNRMKSVLRG